MSNTGKRDSFRQNVIRDIGVAVLAVAVSAVVLISMVLIAVLELEGSDTYYLISGCLSTALFASFFASKAAKRMKASQHSNAYADLVHAFSVAFLAIGAFSGLVFVARTGYHVMSRLATGQMPEIPAMASLLMLLVSVWIVVSLALGPSYNRKEQGKSS